MPAFSGKYYYTLDPKGRLIVPAPFRQIILSHYNPKLYIMNDIFDNCLHICPQEEWAKVEERVRQLPRSSDEIKLFLRRVVATVQEIEMDKQGRILIPASHREDAGLKADVVLVGQVDKIDLWDREEWDKVNDISGVDRKAVAETLASYGL